MEKLTAMLPEVVAASGRALKARSTAAAIWREGECAGEGESVQNETEIDKGRHLRLRGTTTELWDTSASKLVLENGDSPAAASCLSAAEKRGEDGARLGAL